MRTFVFANNRVGFEIVAWLATQREQIVGLVLHPKARQKYGNEILAAVNLPSENIFCATDLRRPDTIDRIKQLQPEIGVSVMFGYILKQPILNVFPKGCINIHPSFLPFNRGANPNVWSIIESTPAGVSIHYIDEGIDTGDLIAQQRVDTCPHDTGASLYAKLESVSVELFKKTWPLIASSAVTSVPQPPGGTYHSLKDIELIDEIRLDSQVSAKALIDILRARTFPPYHGAYFRINNLKVYLRLELDCEADERNQDGIV